MRPVWQRARGPLAIACVWVAQACGTLGALGRRTPPTEPASGSSGAPAASVPSTRPTPTATANPATPPAGPPSGPPAATAAPVASPVASPVAVARPADLATAVAARRAVLLADGERLGPDEVGYYMDVQEARLRQLAPSGFVVSRRDSALVVTIPGRQTFDVSSARLLPASLTALSELAKVLVEYRLTIVALNGYTDGSGDAASNLALSQARAVAIARHLLSEGVAAKRMVAVGNGAADPVADNGTAEGREQNRRVEVRIEPLWP